MYIMRMENRHLLLCSILCAYLKKLKKKRGKHEEEIKKVEFIVEIYIYNIVLKNYLE